MNRVFFCFYSVIFVLLSACSDSSGGSSSAANIASVNAGADREVLEGQLITLDAVVYPEGGTVVWVQTQGPFIEGFPTEDELLIEVQAPAVTADADLVFQAEYTSLDGQVVFDEVTIEVTNIDYPPIAIAKLDDTIVPPYATYQEVSVFGTDSYDQDGEIRQYKWQQVDSNPPLNFISDDESSELQFKAPFVSEITQFTLQLTVTDNMGLQGSNTINVQIAAASTVIAANAGADQEVDEFTIVSIDGSDSASSVSDVSCIWQQTHGTQVELDNAESCVTQFIAPDVDAVDELIFVLNVADTAGNEASDKTIVTINPVNLGLLHDTGITSCFSDSEEIECGGTEYPEQDADTGRDNISELLDKSGDGPRSFDFTKFDENGDELPNNSLVFSCVRDNFTGLIWEVKQGASIPEFENLRGAENYYSLDSEQPALSSCPSDSNCGQEQFIDEVNELGFCGGKNWRLPTYIELLNLMDYNDTDSDNLLVSDYFTNTPDVAALGHKFYWVSDGSAEGGTTDFNWVIDLATGDDSAILTNRVAYVILVRTP